MYTLIIVLLIYPCLAIPLTVYDNALFEPSVSDWFLMSLSNVISRNECACQCYSDQYCLTVVYSGMNQQCSLYMARLQQGQMYVSMTIQQSSVLYFASKTLPLPSLLTNKNETIYGIWNTTAGSDSLESTVGNSTGCYFPNEEPPKALDQSNATKYTNFGICTNIMSNLQCGLNTGLYLTLQRGSSLLVGVRFCTGNNYLNRDPLTITIEGSNQPPNALTYGSSWSLIYNGSTGLQNITSRNQFGMIEYISNNSIWYTSYRLLITSKRGNASSVQYTEVELLGY